LRHGFLAAGDYDIGVAIADLLQAKGDRATGFLAKFCASGTGQLSP
jgi:hypothetical protein